MGPARGEQQITVSGPGRSPCNHHGLQVDGTLDHTPARPPLAVLPSTILMSHLKLTSFHKMTLWKLWALKPV